MTDGIAGVERAIPEMRAGLMVIAVLCLSGRRRKW